MNENITTSDTTGATEAVTDNSAVQVQTDQVAQTDSGEESFFDPKQVPEALVPAYKQMQSDYTKKTQALAQERKQAEEWKQKADAYTKYESYVPILEEMLSTKSSQVESPEMAALTSQLKQAGYADDAIELMKMGAQFTLKQFESKQQADKEAQNLNTGIQAAEKADPRLTDSTLVYTMDDGQTVTFGEIVGQIVTADPNWKTNPVEATKAAIKRVDALIGTAKNQGKQELSEAAKAKANKFPATSSSPVSAKDTSQSMDMHEAAAQAKKSLGL